MCRGGFTRTCFEPGCDAVIYCRHEFVCRKHDIANVDDVMVPLLWEGDQV